MLLWLGISALFGLYLAHFNSYEATYGALGGAIIFLTWLWLSSIAMLVGAEINDVLADIKARHDPAAAQLADPERRAHMSTSGRRRLRRSMRDHTRRGNSRSAHYARCVGN